MEITKILAGAFIIFFFIEGAISVSMKLNKWLKKYIKRKVKEYEQKQAI